MHNIARLRRCDAARTAQRAVPTLQAIAGSGCARTWVVTDAAVNRGGELAPDCQPVPWADQRIGTIVPTRTVCGSPRTCACTPRLRVGGGGKDERSESTKSTGTPSPRDRLEIHQCSRCRSPLRRRRGPRRPPRRQSLRATPDYKKGHPNCSNWRCIRRVDQHATLRRSPYCDVTATRKKWYGEGNGMQYEAESVVASKLGDNVSQFVLLKFVTP